MKRLRSLCALGLLTGALLAGCGDDAAPGSESGLGGDRVSLCEATPKSTALAWDEAAPMIGVSPEEAFAGVAGNCTAAFSWDSSDVEVTLDPVWGNSEMRVEIAIDRDSAQLVAPPGESDAEPSYCGASLTAEADVKFETADGVFADSGRVTLRYTKESGFAPFSLSVKSADLGGSLRVELESDQQLSFTYRSGGAGNACVGELQIDFSETRGMTGSAVVGKAGSWSNTACPLGKVSVAFDGSSALGTAITRELEANWTSTAFTGVWDDGSTTSLQVAITSDATSACGETTGLHMVELPVQVVYSTADGYIQEHATDEHMNFFTTGDSVSQAQLILSETLTCKRGYARFTYVDERCSDYARAEAQVSLNRYSDAQPENGRLEVYKYKAAGESGPADAVQRLSIGSAR